MKVQKLTDPRDYTAEIVTFPHNSKAERELRRRHFCLTNVTFLNLRLVITEHDFSPLVFLLTSHPRIENLTVQKAIILQHLRKL